MDDYWKKVYEECGTPSHKIVSRSCFKNLMPVDVSRLLDTEYAQAQGPIEKHMIKITKSFYEIEYAQAPQRVNGDVTNVR